MRQVDGAGVAKSGRLDSIALPTQKPYSPLPRKTCLGLVQRNLVDRLRGHVDAADATVDGIGRDVLGLGWRKRG